MSKSVGLWLLIAALVTAQILIGGTRMLYCIPACLLIAGAVLLSVGSGFKNIAAPHAGCLAATIAFCAYLLARNRLSPVEFLARPDFFTITGALAVYLLTALVFTRSKWRAIIFYVLLGLGVAHAAIGAIQFKNANQFMLLPNIRRMDNMWRASGFYISPNHYAGMLEIMVLMALSFFCWKRLAPTARIIVGYAGGICLAGLAISGSRGGYLSVTAGLAMFLILSLALAREVSPRRIGFWIGGAAAAVAGLVGVVLLLSSSSTIGQRIQTIDDQKNPRPLLWKAALKQWHLEPLWGTGAGTYLYYGRQFREPVIQNDPIYVHNDYLHLLAEYGVAGAALFLVFFGSHIFAGVQNLRRLMRDRASSWEYPASQAALQLGALSSIGAYTVHSCVDFNLHIPANAFLMAWIFGIVAHPGLASERESPKPARAVGMAGLGAMAAAALAILYFGVPQLPGAWYAEQARVALRDYHLPQAREAAARAIRFDPSNADVYYYAGEAMREMAEKGLAPKSDAETAAGMFQKALELFPQDERSVMKLAQTYDQLGQFDLAEEQLDRALELDPNNSYPFAFFGMHYQRQHMPMEAGEYYQAALNLDSGNPMARAGMEAVKNTYQQGRALMRAQPESAEDENPAPAASPLRGGAPARAEQPAAAGSPASPAPR